jgi:flagellar L-ring protein precursor FlgH
MITLDQSRPLARLLITLVAFLVLAGAAGAQSLWNPQHPQPAFFADATARNVGDILSVVISEQQKIKNQEKSTFDKESTLDAALEDFKVFPDAFNPLPTVKGRSTREFEGDAKYDKTGSFETRVSVVVIDVLPNGNMLIEGRRKVVIDKETKTMRLTGLVRPFDVTSVNTVLSSQVANASIAYEGVGPLTTATNRGWLSNLLDTIWPF